MDFFKDKKVIALVIVGVIIFITSILLYKNNNNKVFRDKYMDNIFVEENNNAQSDNTIDQQDKKEIVVEIKGEVNNPDVYRLDEGSIIKDLIDRAGGLTIEADISNVNRAKQLQNNELIVINNINDDNQSVAASTTINNGQDNNGLININSASADELKKIPGVGDVKAQSIIDYRESNGGFKNLEEMKNIDGIGDKTFEKMKDKITL